MQIIASSSENHTERVGLVVRSVKLLWSSSARPFVASGFFEIHDQDFCSFPDMYVFRNGASSSTKEGSVFLFRRYVCCTAVSARGYPPSGRLFSLRDFVVFLSSSRKISGWYLGYVTTVPFQILFNS
jgi:hypothetical protein